MVNNVFFLEEILQKFEKLSQNTPKFDKISEKNCEIKKDVKYFQNSPKVQKCLFKEKYGFYKIYFWFKNIKIIGGTLKNKFKFFLHKIQMI